MVYKGQHTIFGPPGENVPTKNVMQVNAENIHIDHLALK